MIIIDSHQQTVTEETDIYTCIHGTFYFPFQVGVGIPDYPHRYRRAASYRYHAIGFHQLQGVIRIDRILITGKTVAGTQFQIIQESELFHKILLRDYPGSRDRRKEPPFIILADFGGSIRTGIDRRHIFPGIHIVDTSQKRTQPWVFIIRIRSLPKTYGPCLQIIISEFIR